MTREITGRTVYRIGVISDTHGKLPPNVERHFSGADLIVHAGDVGGEDILEMLELIAPVVAVRGNTDFGDWAYKLNSVEMIQVGRVRICVIHDVQRLNIQGMTIPHAVIHGHSHKPSAGRENNILFLNPGSAVDPRHSTEPSLAVLHIEGTVIDAQFIPLL